MNGIKDNCDYDVAVIGGGLAGLSLSAILARHDMTVACIDVNAPATMLGTGYDVRTTAISAGSRHVLELTGIWDDLAPGACPITDIEIRDGPSPVELDFNAGEVGAEAFGWIVENHDLRRALIDQAKALQGLHHIAPARVADMKARNDYMRIIFEDGAEITARLVIGADGRNSLVRRRLDIGTRGHAYGQQAIVCIVNHQYPHANCALEHFREEGPFAVLPMRDDSKGRHRSAIVWTETAHKQASAMAYDTKTFNAALQARFPARYGRVELAGSCAAYPLGLLHAYRYTGHRVALVGDAAHAIHPIAGQGLNMGLRDIADITERIINAYREDRDIGACALLGAYENARLGDNMAMGCATDSLNALFSNTLPGIRLARRIGLGGVGRITPVKRFFMTQAMGAPQKVGA